MEALQSHPDLDLLSDPSPPVAPSPPEPTFVPGAALIGDSPAHPDLDVLGTEPYSPPPPQAAAPAPSPTTSVDFSAKWTPGQPTPSPVVHEDADLLDHGVTPPVATPSQGGPSIWDQTGGLFKYMMNPANDPKGRAMDAIAGQTIPEKLAFAASVAANPESGIMAGLTNMGLMTAGRTGKNLFEGKPLGQSFDEATSATTKIPFTDTEVPALAVEGLLPGAVMAGGRFIKGLTQPYDPITRRFPDRGLLSRIEMPVPKTTEPIPELTADMGAVGTVGTRVRKLWNKAATWGENSALPALNQLSQRMRAYSSTLERLTADAKARLAQALKGATKSEIESEIGLYMSGRNPNASQRVRDFARRIQNQVDFPLADRAEASGMTTLDEKLHPGTTVDTPTGPVDIPPGKVQTLVPFKRRPGMYFPEREATITPGVRGVLRDIGRAKFNPWAFRRTGPVTTPDLNVARVWSSHIDEMVPKITQAETMGGVTQVDPKMPYGDHARRLLTEAFNDGGDHMGATLASDALRSIYEPAKIDPALGRIFGIPGQMVLGQNPITQIPQSVSNFMNSRYGRTAEGIGRWINSPEFRGLHQRSGAMGGGIIKSLNEAAALPPESLLGKVMRFTDTSLNRGILSSGVTPEIEALEKAAIQNRWTPDMEALANRAGLSRQQLQGGLTQGDLQIAQAHLVQRRQLNPGGAGERLRGLENPYVRAMGPWLDFLTNQASLAKQDYVKPLFSRQLPQTAGKIARGIGGAAVLEPVALAVKDVISGKGLPSTPEEAKQFAARAVGKGLNTHLGALSIPLEAWLTQGVPGAGNMAESPFFSVGKELLSPFDKNGVAAENFLDYLIAGGALLAPESRALQTLPFFRNTYRNAVKHMRKDMRGG